MYVAANTYHDVMGSGRVLATLQCFVSSHDTYHDVTGSGRVLATLRCFVSSHDTYHDVMGRGRVLATLEFAMPTNIHLVIKYKAAQSLKTVMGAVMDAESVVF